MSAGDGEAGDFAGLDEFFAFASVLRRVPRVVIQGEVRCGLDRIGRGGLLETWAVGVDVAGEGVEVELGELIEEELGSIALNACKVFGEFVLADRFELCGDGLGHGSLLRVASIYKGCK